MSVPNIRDAALLLLRESPKTPVEIAYAINTQPRLDYLRARWIRVDVDQVYAAMSGLRSKTPGKSLIEPVNGRVGKHNVYRLTARGIGEAAALRTRLADFDAAPPVNEQPPSPDLPQERVNHPQHYGGDTTYEVIKVLEAWGLDKDFCLGNTVKYIARADKKGANVEDLEKARWYLDRKIARLKGEPDVAP